jgi:hypothetical protein
MNMTYGDVTDATENFIRELFANDEPLAPAEIEVRSAIAQAALKSWYEHARGLVLDEVHKSEYLRLEELAFALPAGARVIC